MKKSSVSKCLFGRSTAAAKTASHGQWSTVLDANTGLPLRAPINPPRCAVA
jgi:hypothetical protein